MGLNLFTRLALLGVTAGVTAGVTQSNANVKIKDLEKQKLELVTQLENEKSDKQKYYDALVESAQTLEAKNILIENLTSTLNTTKTDLTTATNNLNLKQSELNSKIEELNIANSNVENLQSLLDSANEDKVLIQEQLDIALQNKSTLETEVATLTSERDALQIQLDALIEENTTLQNTITTLNQQIEELERQIADLQPKTTPASYFNFVDGEIMGFSEEGQALYDSNELTEITFPSSYSLGEPIQLEKTFSNADEFLGFFSSNVCSYPIIINDGKLSINSIEDLDEKIDSLLSMKNFTASIPILTFIDGNDYSVIKAGYYSFADCDKLVSITFPVGITEIADYAFMNCSNLTNITIPNTVTTLGSHCFAHSNIVDIIIPDSVTYIASLSFAHCTSLKNVKLSENVTTIREGVFYGCTSLEEITIPNSLKHLDRYIFRDCTSLSKITLGINIETISNSCFANCTSLTTIWIPASVTEMSASTSDSHFLGCSSSLKIYCEHESEPSNFNCWNYYSSSETLTVEWGVSFEEYQQIISGNSGTDNPGVDDDEGLLPLAIRINKIRNIKEGFV